jgi:phage recombination protein Bet
MGERSTALVPHAPASRALQIVPLEFTEEDRQIIRASICPTASDAEFASLMKIAAIKRLNPLTGQIHFVKRRQQIDGQWITRWTTQTSIDGLRAIAERTGQYDGQDEPEFLYDNDGHRLICCKVRVYKKGISRAFVGVAMFEEYAVFGDKGLTFMWANKPHVMLSKCAEAQGLRRAFPEETNSLYIPEEMGDVIDTTLAPSAPKAPVLDLEPTEPQPQAPPPETIEQQTERLLRICADEGVTMEQLRPVYTEGLKMPEGEHRKRVSEGYVAAVARVKARKQTATHDFGREPGQEG